MKKNILFFIFIFNTIQTHAQKLTSLVDPFLGTGGHGHVYPGATVPFGMVQLSPDNGNEGWDWCSGYHYSSNTIAGFSHTHLSGTGIGDWCDISLLPLNDTSEIRKSKILLPFNHGYESAKPGYYQVKLNNGINCELTATKRNGYHKYTYPNKNAWLRFDMGFAINWDRTTASMITIINDSTLVGYRFSNGWATGQKIYFAARFSEKFDQHIFISDSIETTTKAIGKNIKLALHFYTQNPLFVRVSLSTVDVKKALFALNETANNSFVITANNADKLWENELEKIKINTNNKQQAQKFYIALYRTCLAPVVQSDEDKSYQTHDNKKLVFAKGENKYTVFSQWDVFRALNPLFTITQPKRLPDMINSMLQLYQDNGLLPVWDLSSWETNTMTGYHSVPIVADAILKNIQGFDYALAYTAMKKSAFQKIRGTPDYIKYGYLPQDKHGWSVTITLEYAFDDWCIAQVAKKLGYQKDYQLFLKRAMSYKHLFDSTSGFMRAKNSNGNFIEPFDPILSEHGDNGQYVEGTAWQHSFFVPHDVEGLARLYGGKNYLIKKLDELFTAPSVLHGVNVSSDISGLIGQYAHGNEPSHHIIYMYSALGENEKATHWLKVVTDSLYKTGVEGLSGNEDCGQMSAWYVWTMLGMYPMNPASGEYVFGYPFVNSAAILLPNNKKLLIQKKILSLTDNSPKIVRIIFNGKPINALKIQHQQLLQGGTLVIETSH